MRPLILLLTLVAVPLGAQVVPVPQRDDPRLGELRYASDKAFQLAIPVGREVTVLLPPGERLSAVSVAAAQDWQVEQGAALDSVVVRPNGPVPDTSLSVLTSARDYSFVLSSAPEENAPRFVRITGVPRSAQEELRAPDATDWKLSGNRELWPSQIRDDGVKTYLEWNADQPLPAVFSVDRLGREEMVNGYMRGTIFTIDRVHEHLLFRIDKAHADARRKVRRSGA